MAQPEGSPVNGIVMRGADGSLYFLRDHTLAECRVTEPEMATALEQMLEGQGDVSGFTTAGDPVTGSTRITGSVRPNGGGSGGTRSTIMCPW